MNITIDNRQGGIAVVRLDGQLDLLSTADVKKRLAYLVDQGATLVIVDMGNVSFIDSSGLAALISGLKTTRIAGGNLCIARPGSEVRTILELTRMDQILQMYTTVEEAIVAC